MDKNFLIQLTLHLYQLTLLFPKKEPLRYKMREIADEILTNLIRSKQNDTKILNNPNSLYSGKIYAAAEILPEELDILDSYFEVAKAQNWVKPEEILNLQKKYSKIKEELKTEVDSEKTLNLPFEPSIEGRTDRSEVGQEIFLGQRQEKILGILKEKGRAQVWEAKKIFPEVSKRTLRRDFEHLLKQGLIERMGERNETFYRLKER